jgi:hypothetical protein
MMFLLSVVLNLLLCLICKLNIIIGIARSTVYIGVGTLVQASTVGLEIFSSQTRGQVKMCGLGRAAASGSN